MHKLFVLILIICCVGGCTSRMAVSNSTTIGTDAKGLAVGQYSDSRSGEIQSPVSMWFGGGGGGGGSSSNGSSLSGTLLGPIIAAVGAASSAGGSSAGAGALGGGFSTGQVETQGDPMKFARAIATINYSRRLVTVDDAGGARNFTFTDSPLRKSNYQPFGNQTE